MERWHQKVAVVTGASAGIGAACCKELLAQGMIVVGLARRVELMEKNVRESLTEEQKPNFHALKCDVTIEQDIIDAFKWVDEHLGGVAVLINNAGMASIQTQLVDENNTDTLRAILDVNVLGVALCTREAFRSMKRRNFDGHVILINSVLGHHVIKRPNRSFNMYSPSKFAVTAMNEVLRQEFLLNDTKIKVTSLSPGLVDTELSGSKSFYPPDIPILNPEDIVNGIVFCLQTPPHVQIHELTIIPVGQYI